MPPKKKKKKKRPRGRPSLMKKPERRNVSMDAWHWRRLDKHVKEQGLDSRGAAIRAWIESL